MTGKPYNRDRHVLDLLIKANAGLESVLVALKTVPAGQRPKSLGSPFANWTYAVQPGPKVHDDRLTLLWVTPVLLAAASDVGQAECNTKDLPDEALKIAKGEIQAASSKLQQALHGLGASVDLPEEHQQKVREAEGHLNQAKFQVERAAGLVSTLKDRALRIASDSNNYINKIPIGFCVLEPTTPDLVKEQIDALAKQMKDQKDKENAAQKGSGPAAPPANRLTAPPARTAAAKPISGMTHEQSEMALEKQEIAEEADEEKKREAEGKAREKAQVHGVKTDAKPSFWERKLFDFSDKTFDHYLDSLRTIPLRDAYVILLKGDNPNNPGAVEYARTNSRGTLHWMGTGEQAFLEPEQTYWCFWTYDKERFEEAAAELKQPPAMGAFSLVREYGLFKFHMRPEPLQTNEAALFDLWDDLYFRDYMAVLLHNLSDGHGYVRPLGKASPEFYKEYVQTGNSNWVYAQTPGLASIYFTEFLNHLVAGITSKSAWYYTQIDKVAGIVAASEQTIKTGDRIRELDLAAMRSIRSSDRVNSRAFIGMPNAMARWRMRGDYDKHLDYVRRVAGASRRADGGGYTSANVNDRYCPLETLKLALCPGRSVGQDNFWWSHGAGPIQYNYGVKHPARILIPDAVFTDRYAMPHPQSLGTSVPTDECVKSLLNYYAFYRYHRLVLDPEQPLHQHGWYRHFEDVKSEIKVQRERLRALAAAHLKEHGPAPLVFADIAWHVKGVPEHPFDPARLDWTKDDVFAMHYRYINVAAEVGHPWWNDFPNENTAEFKDAMKLSKLIEKSFKGLNKATGLIKKFLEHHEHQITRLMAESAKVFENACEKMGAVNTILGGKLDDLDVKGLQLAVFRDVQTVERNGKQVKIVSRSLRFSKGSDWIGEGMPFRLKDRRPQLIGSSHHRDFGIEFPGDKLTVNLQESTLLKNLEKERVIRDSKVPRVFGLFFQIGITAFGVAEFANKPKDANAIFVLTGNIGAFVGSFAAAMELTRFSRTSLFSGLDSVTKASSTFFGVVNVFQTFKDGVLVAFEEAPGEEAIGNTVRARILYAKSAVMIVSSVSAAAFSVARIATLGLGAAATGPVGWIMSIGGVIVFGLDMLAQSWGEPATFMTDLEKDLVIAIEKEFGEHFGTHEREYTTSRTADRLKVVANALEALYKQRAGTMRICVIPQKGQATGSKPHSPRKSAAATP